MCVHVCGIQFLVLSDQIAVHLFVSGFEVIHIRLVWSRAWEFHVGSGTERSHIETALAAETWRKCEQLGNTTLTQLDKVTETCAPVNIY